MLNKTKTSTLLFLLSSSLFTVLFTVLFAKQVRADCTRWHPHHCAQEKLENTPFDPNTWNPVDWVNSGAGELCETNSIATAQRNIDREQGLDPIQKEYLRPYFGNLVDEVTVKWNSLLNDEWTFQGRTVEAGSAGQTYGNTIYIAEKRQPRSTSQLTLLAHEFRHVQQYRQRGNLDNFCREYMTAYANAQFNYENNSFEKDAYEFDYKFASELKNKIPSTYSYDYEYTHSTPSWNKRSAVVLPTELPEEIPSPEVHIIGRKDIPEGVPNLMIQTEGYPVVAVFSERKESFALGCSEIRSMWNKIPVQVVDSSIYNSIQATNPVIADLSCNGNMRAYAPKNEPGALLIRHRDGSHYRYYINDLGFIGALNAGDLIPIEASEFRTSFPNRGTDFKVFR